MFNTRATIVAAASLTRLVVKSKGSFSNSTRASPTKLLLLNGGSQQTTSRSATNTTSPASSSSSSEQTIPSSCPYHQKDATSNKEEVKPQPWTEVPGPKPLPLIGNLIQVQTNSKNMSEYLMTLCKQYGDLVKLTVFNFNMLMIANPHLLGELYKKEERRNEVDSFRHYKLKKGQILTPVEMRYDEDWYSIRQLYNIAMKPEYQETITLPQLSELNGDFMRRLIKSLQSVKGSEAFKYVNSSETNSRYAFDVVMKVFLGVKMTDEVTSTLPFDINEFVNYTVHATDVAVRLTTKFPMYKYYRTQEYKSFENLMDKSSEYARYCIQRFKTNPSQNARLLELIEERAKDQDRPDERVESVLMQFLQGGVDITVRIMNNCFHRLAHHPECQEKIYKESVAVFGEPSLEEVTSEDGLSINLEQYKKLKYTKHFIDEVLRLNAFGYLTMGRKLDQDTEIGGYMIPKDTMILAMQRWATLKDEFVPRGEEFIPERHEKGSPLAPVNNFVSLPFGVGARKCPGSRVATTELLIGIINAVRHFQLCNNNLASFPPSSFDQSLLYIDSEKYPLYFTPRDHVKEFVEKNSKVSQ
ncbi:predicted protein [Naegleria gruberi]|uniref:Predicted protein n=1 Tax=Naegleria gruberi TaxID=5762 RepID=D2VUZ8_NAEGR|nr:uncharacterized protein NAEGRDRAFT_81316 [Naegleria gruberi]EFC39354.1 predicted protein [Naegleria gruberi]|eukprot:XP_002672098.1 predicted protein [Naegleria gruberi strain NEG-M]